MKIYLFTCAACIFLVYSCKNKQEINTPGKEAFLDINGIDTTIAPGDNYFRYINDKWINETAIPPTEIGAGSFFDLQTKSEKALLEVCQAAASIESAPLGSLEQKVGDMYLSIMDTIAIEAKGYSPLQPIFNKISSLKNTTDLIQYVCEQNINGNDVLINFGAVLSLIHI